MANSSVSDGEVSPMRRNISRNPRAYSSATRAALSSVADPLAFLADENIQFKNLMMSDVLIKISIAERRGREFNPDNYYNTSPITYRKSHPKFKVSSRDGYLVERDFLTNQPIFRKY